MALSTGNPRSPEKLQGRHPGHGGHQFLVRLVFPQAALIVLGAASPDLSALLIRNVLGVLIGIATGLVQIVTLVFA